MVGMKEVKKAVNAIAQKIAYDKKIYEQTGKMQQGEGNNICITGNPGTGKTTIVRALAKLFKAIDLLPDDRPLEIQGADIKGSYVGQSKDKVNEYCRQALGRVFFIDEAYTLVNENGPVDGFANEAITQLMAHLENDRDKYVCIVAGYPKEMDTFIKKGNPGLERRFKHYIHIPDYSADELFEIFERFNIKKGGYTLTDEAREKARQEITDMVANKGPTFGNAGAVRTFYERITSNTASRVSKLPENEQLAVLQLIEVSDIPSTKDSAEKSLSVDEVLAELDAMIGMTDIKRTVREIANKIQIQKEQEEIDGTKSAGEGNNIVITGNPGTGKTTIVRTLGALFKAIGLLKSDKVIEVNGNDLKGSYLGQSKDKVNEKCDEAMGGILFVDEAYVLADTQRGGAADSFAREAVEILMTRLENDRSRFVGVVAGYEKEMQVFLDTVNPGMRRRFKHYLSLTDYNADELFAIFNSMLKKPGYSLTPEASISAKAAITDMYDNKGPNFGNAGEIRVFFERTTSRLATRLSALSREERADKLKIIEACDIPVRGGNA